jgi:BirA family biotin operon repressor/biotin-[acetyl-CoA-carboxylase] ligase
MSRAETQPLAADELKRGLSTLLIGRQIVVLERTDSTNDAILRFATSNLQEGLVLFAEHQTAGRGQRGNRWESAEGKGLWFSILLRPGIDIADSPLLTAWAARAVRRTMQQEFGLQPVIKFPNDVQIDGRKVAGVLVEMRAQKQSPHLAITGIGINVNQTAKDFSDELRGTAISLAMALGRQVDRQQFAAALLRELDRTYGEAFPNRRS